MKVFKYLIPIVAAFVVLGVVLYFIHPYAPLLLLASLIIQAPIVYLITRYTYNGAYSDRVYARREKFDEDGDAAAWLQKEEQEAEGFGFGLLSKKTQAQNTLIRAELLAKLGRPEEAGRLLDEVDVGQLDADSQRRFYEMKSDVAATLPQEAESSP